MRFKKVSVIIISYNFSKFIEDSLASVLNQTYPNLEIIVCDDGSTDGTQQIVRSFADQHPHIIPLLSDRNNGLCQNINRGLDRFEGEYVALLSGDDLMRPNKIIKQVEFLDRHKDCGLCTHDMDVFENSTGKTLYNTKDRYRLMRNSEEMIFATNWLFGREVQSIPSSIMGRRDCLLAHRFDERLKVRNEWLYVIECLATTGTKWGHLPEVLGRYRVHDKQMHSSKEAAKLSFEEAMIVLAIASVRYPELAHFIKDKRNYLLFQHLVYNWHKPEMMKAFERQFLIEAGAAKWLYMKLARFFVQHPNLIQGSRPFRKVIQRFLN